MNLLSQMRWRGSERGDSSSCLIGPCRGDLYRLGKTLLGWRGERRSVWLCRGRGGGVGREMGGEWRGQGGGGWGGGGGGWGGGGGEGGGGGGGGLGGEGGWFDQRW